MTPRARVRHALAERTRFSIDGMRLGGDYFARVRDELSALPEVGAVRINPDSASVVVEHVSGALAAVATQARQRELFDVRALEPEDAPLLQQVLAGLASVSAGFRRSAPGGLGPEALAYAALAATAVVQISRGQIVVPAATLAWSALRLWEHARRAPQQAATGGLPRFALAGRMWN